MFHVKLAVILFALLAACAPTVKQTPYMLALAPGRCTATEVGTSWLAKNVYANCMDYEGHVFPEYPGNATSGGQALVNAFSTAATAGTLVGVVSQFPNTFKLQTPGLSVAPH